jgi:hypothetical protein
MSQHSFVEPNEAGAAYRAGINNALQALASRSSGASAPATTYAYQPWCDTTNGVLKQRNAANSAWIIRDTLAETRVISRSSNTILGIGDYGCTFLLSSTFTQTLTAAATLADGWHCYVRNNGSGVITVDPNSTETIDGGLVLTLNPGEGCRISCNGTAFTTQGLAWKIVKRKTADESVSGSTTLQDDDHLLFPIGASEEWIADFYVAADEDAAGGQTGIKIAINAPSAATIMVLAAVIANPSTPDPTKNQAVTKTTTTIAAALDFTTTIFNYSAVVGYSISIHVWILNSTNAGNVTLQWCDSTATGTTLKFRKGSHMIANRIA